MNEVELKHLKKVAVTEKDEDQYKLWMAVTEKDVKNRAKTNSQTAPGMAVLLLLQISKDIQKLNRNIVKLNNKME